MTLAELRGVATRLVRAPNAPRLVAVKAPARWDHPDELEVEGERFTVIPAGSSLALRAALANFLAAEEGKGIILTELPEEEIGAEVLARLWGHRVHRTTGFDAVQSLFRVRELDARLADERWLVDLLVEVSPVQGYAPPKSGILDLDTAWQTWLRHGLRLDSERPQLTDLLRWGEQANSQALLGGSVKAHLEKVAQRLGGADKATMAHVLRLTSEGRGKDLVPLGLVADTLWNGTLPETPALTQARTRFEGPLGTRGMTAQSARSWGEAAVTLVRRAHRLSDEAARTRWLNRAEGLLTAELGAGDLAHASDVLPRGFEQRMEHAGSLLLTHLSRPSESTEVDVAAAVLRAAGHLRASGAIEEERVERLSMAARVIRRWTRAEPMKDPEKSSEDLASQARQFVTDGAWVDRAREAMGHGESSETLASAYAAVIARLDAERSARDKRFAQAVARWSQIEPGQRPPLLPVERVLDEVVVPVAKQAPVLLIVLDGWSHPLASLLLTDLAELGWARVGPVDDEHPIVVSALPSVTRVSRTSLLCGARIEGTQDQERAGWEAHAGLRKVAAKDGNPLFHRADLATREGRETGSVRDAISNLRHRVVGVVVNAIDEHLDKGGQLRLASGLQALRPVSPLLAAAQDAGRVVIVASDHGHVLENGSVASRQPGAAERWRLPHPPAGAGEIEIKGPRVLVDGGAIVVPDSEGLRYISAKKHGYHGGVTPQEVLCPLAVVLPPGVALDGWGELSTLEPWWWRAGGRPIDLERLRIRAERKSEAPEVHIDPTGQADLFGAPRKPPIEVEAVGIDLPRWLQSLVASHILEAQREIAGRGALQDEDLVSLLLALEAARGVARINLVAEHLGLPIPRARSKVAALQRMMNIDGYQVVATESDGTIRFNRDLLVTQFRVEP